MFPCSEVSTRWCKKLRTGHAVRAAKTGMLKLQGSLKNIISFSISDRLLRRYSLVPDLFLAHGLAVSCLKPTHPALWGGDLHA